MMSDRKPARMRSTLHVPPTEAEVDEAAWRLGEKLRALTDWLYEKDRVKRQIEREGKRKRGGR